MTKPKRVNDDVLRKLWGSSLLDRELAERMGHHRGVLRRRACKLGLPPRTVLRRGQA